MELPIFVGNIFTGFTDNEFTGISGNGFTGFLSLMSEEPRFWKNLEEQLDLLQIFDTTKCMTNDTKI